MEAICTNITNLIDLITAAENEQLNITDTVRSCPDLCGKVWGEGNPDLDGVGTVLVALLVPIVPVATGILNAFLYDYAHPTSKKHWLHLIGHASKPREDAHDTGHDEPEFWVNKLVARLSTMQLELFSACVLVAIPVHIASIVWLKQSTLLFELAYLLNLNMMQFLCVLGSAVTAFPLTHLKAAFMKPMTIFKHASWISLCCILSFALCMASVAIIKDSSGRLSKVPELVMACRSYGAIVPTTPPTVNLDRASSDKVALVFALLFSKSFWWAGTLLGAVFLIAAAGSVYLMLFPPFAAMVTLGLLGGQFYYLVEMQIIRNSLRSAAGEDFTDDQWGFGQVLSIFIWPPVVWSLGQVVVGSLYDYRHRHQKYAEEPSFIVRGTRRISTENMGSDYAEAFTTLHGNDDEQSVIRSTHRMSDDVEAFPMLSLNKNGV